MASNSKPFLVLLTGNDQINDPNYAIPSLVTTSNGNKVYNSSFKI